MDVEFRAHANAREALEKAKSGTGTLLAANGDGTKDVPIRMWEMHYSYSNNNPIQKCVWNLTEIEELNIESLQLGDVKVTPYQYGEKFGRDALIITARFQVDRVTEEALRRLPKYFPVIRHGIASEPRSMRFGQIMWSSADEETFKLHATIVEEVFDNRNGRGLFQPEFGNMIRSISAAQERIDRILNALQEKRIITQEEKDALQQVDDDVRRKREDQFSRVADIDEFLRGDDEEDAALKEEGEGVAAES